MLNIYLAHRYSPAQEFHCEAPLKGFKGKKKIKGFMKNVGDSNKGVIVIMCIKLCTK